MVAPLGDKLCVSTEEGNERAESRLEASYLGARLRLRNGDDLRNHESLQYRSLVAASWSNTRTLRRISLMPSPLSKSALIESITKLQTDGTTKRQVKSVVEALVTVGHKELKKSGVFLVPGFAKFVVVKKPATKARKGINPFTKEPTVFKAKPARKVVKARPVKAVKDAIA
jgi:DNA-binding protein HU-beta